MGLRERITFIGQLRADFEHTGAVQPSSRFLARAMAAPIRGKRSAAGAKPLRIQEIGPGTGAVTRAIAASMGPEDELTCYEISERFARYLQNALSRDPVLMTVAERVTIHNAAAQDLDRSSPFDVAVCSAPLNNFGAETIEAILAAILGALAADGQATLFEYVAFPALRRFFSRGAAGERLRAAEAIKAKWISRYGDGSVLELRNLPPARVHLLRKM
jgi:phospholipid N-methyltransferase